MARAGVLLASVVPLLLGAAAPEGAKPPPPKAPAPPAEAKAAPTPAAPAPTVAVRRLAPLSLGLTGYGGEDVARQDSARLNRFLSDKLGWSVVTPILPSYEALAAAIASGTIDIGWVQPYAAVHASKKGSILPLVKAVRHGLPFYRSVLFVRTDRKGEGLASLKGAKVGWVGPASSSGYLFARAAIVQAGMDPGKLFSKEEMLGDHFAVCLGVLEGKVDVGATFADDRPDGAPRQVDGCVQALGVDAGRRLRILADSAPIPNDVIAARPGLPAGEVDRIRKAFLKLHESEEGRTLLATVFKAESFAEVGEGDFEPVRFADEAASR